MSGAKVVYIILTVLCVLGNGSVICFQELTTVVRMVRTISWLVVFLMPITQTVQLYIDIIKLMATQNSSKNVTTDKKDEEKLKDIIFIFRLYVILWFPSITMLLAAWLEPNEFLQAMLYSGLFSYIMIKYWYVIKLRDMFANKQKIFAINGISPTHCHLQNQKPCKQTDNGNPVLDTVVDISQLESEMISTGVQPMPISLNDVHLVGSDSASDPIAIITPTMTTKESSTQVEALPPPIVHTASQATPDSPKLCKHPMRPRSNSVGNPKSSGNPDLSLSFDTATLGTMIRKTRRMSEQTKIPGAVDDPTPPSIHDLRQYRQRRLSTAKQRRDSRHLLSLKNKNKIEPIDRTEDTAF